MQYYFIIMQICNRFLYHSLFFYFFFFQLNMMAYWIVPRLSFITMILRTPAPIRLMEQQFHYLATGNRQNMDKDSYSRLRSSLTQKHCTCTLPR